MGCRHGASTHAIGGGDIRQCSICITCTLGVCVLVEHVYGVFMSGSVIDEETSGGSDPAALETEIAEIAGSLNVLNARLVAVTEQALDADLLGHGIHSVSQWLAYQAGLSPSHAKQIVEIAEQRASFPLVIDAFDRGALAVDQVHVAVTRAPAWADDRVLHFTHNATVTQLRRAIRAERFEGDPDHPDPQPTPQDRERLSTSNTDTGQWRINGQLDLDRGAIIDNALTEARDSLFEQGHTEVTWADALVEIAERSLDTIPSESRRERFKTWVHLDTGGDATLTAGWRIPMAIRDRIMCDGAGPTGVGTRRHPVLGRTHPTDRPRAHPPDRRTPRPWLPSPRVHRRTVRRDPPHHPLAQQRPHRHLEPGELVQETPPHPSPRPARHQR